MDKLIFSHQCLFICFFIRVCNLHLNDELLWHAPWWQDPEIKKKYNLHDVQFGFTLFVLCTVTKLVWIAKWDYFTSQQLYELYFQFFKICAHSFAKILLNLKYVHCTCPAQRSNLLNMFHSQNVDKVCVNNEIELFNKVDKTLLRTFLS